MEPFKNIYNEESLYQFAKTIKKSYPSFETQKFVESILKDIHSLEMKDRVKFIAGALYEFLPKDFNKATNIMIGSLAKLKYHEVDKTGRNEIEGIHGFMAWPLTQYIETYGLEDLDTSLIALYEMTQRFTSEFSIRPFLALHDKALFKTLSIWKKDKNHHVRRLVSEGTRPRLPWGIKVNSINSNLKRNITLIHSLRLDPSPYVRKSVANHLNDISYLDEDLFFLALNKMGDTEKEIWIKRHATRSLLKKGHPQALAMHGYNTNIKITPTFSISKKSIKEGDSFELTLKIKNPSKKEEKLLIDYIIHYPKKTGKYTTKVFRLRDTKINSDLSINKKIHFKKVTTRVHYSGIYFIEVQINGILYKKISFELQD